MFGSMALEPKFPFAAGQNENAITQSEFCLYLFVLVDIDSLVGKITVKIVVKYYIIAK